MYKKIMQRYLPYKLLIFLIRILVNTKTHMTNIDSSVEYARCSKEEVIQLEPVRFDIVDETQYVAIRFDPIPKYSPNFIRLILLFSIK